jgi:hypothetical protein
MLRVQHRVQDRLAAAHIGLGSFYTRFDTIRGGLDVISDVREVASHSRRISPSPYAVESPTCYDLNCRPTRTYATVKR